MMGQRSAQRHSAATSTPVGRVEPAVSVALPAPARVMAGTYPEVPWLKIRCSPELLVEIAAALGCTVAIGEPDDEGFHEPVFMRSPAMTDAGREARKKLGLPPDEDTSL